MIKLNLGSGNTKAMKNLGFINIDINKFHYVDVVHNIEKQLPYNDNVVDEIYTSHALEHCRMKAVPVMLKDWYRVLKDDGIVTIIVPEIEACMRNFLNAPEAKKWGKLIEYILGGQHHQAGQQEHKSAYTPAHLTQLLRAAGFVVDKLEIINNKVNDCIHLNAHKE